MHDAMRCTPEQYDQCAAQLRLLFVLLLVAWETIVALAYSAVVRQSLSKHDSQCYTTLLDVSIARPGW